MKLFVNENLFFPVFQTWNNLLEGISLFFPFVFLTLTISRSLSLCCRSLITRPLTLPFISNFLVHFICIKNARHKGARTRRLNVRSCLLVNFLSIFPLKMRYYNKDPFSFLCLDRLRMVPKTKRPLQFILWPHDHFHS